MKRCGPFYGWVIVIGLLALTVSHAVQEVTLISVARQVAQRSEHVWQKACDLAPNLTSPELFLYALALCEAGEHLERLERLFEIAERMQDRDQESRSYGNLRWYWRDGAVLDYNAVEFSMRCAVLIWMRHRESISSTARRKLHDLLRYGIEGCLRHRVPPSYTNIALMNAQNLILLGEALNRSDVAGEGYKRFEQFCIYTWQNGIHEYCSPTYYGVDLDCLLLIEAFCKRDDVRRWARALLELLWTDIALNWFEPAQRLAGTHSRDYDFLYGLGYLDAHLRMFGWLPVKASNALSLFAVLSEWRPPSHLRELTRRYPRLVRQKWGADASNARTHYVTRCVTLSTSCASYGSSPWAMDTPLTVDLPGDRRRTVRCYFIPSARRDPYGKKPLPEPLGPHRKAYHLNPLFIATQHRKDALALTIYRRRDFPENPSTLESHFVIPLDIDEVWIGGSRFEMPVVKPFVRVLKRDEVLALRKGPAAVGIRVVWARALDGKPAPVALIYDGNEYNAMRLTVAHHNFWGMQFKSVRAGVALWVRIGDGLRAEKSFRKWLHEFQSAPAKVNASSERIQIEVRGEDGRLTVASGAPFLGALVIFPPPTQAILECDGRDIGRELLGDIEPIKAYLASRQVKREMQPIVLSLQKGTYWEAESGTPSGAMVIGTDDDAFGGKFVWMPGEPGGQGSGNGSITWRLKVPREGRYYLWGRVLAPTPDDDSFYVRVFTDVAEPVRRAEWHTGTHLRWEWTRITLGRPPKTVDFIMLPEGEVSLQLLVREDGTKIDRLFITAEPKDMPH